MGSGFGTGWNGYSATIRKSGLMVMRSDCPYLNKTEAGSQCTYPASGTTVDYADNPAFAIRSAMPERGYLVGVGLAVSTRPTGTNPIVGFNVAAFGADESTVNLPFTSILGPSAFGNAQIRHDASGSSAQLLEITFGEQVFLDGGDSWFLMGLWTLVSGSFAASSQGGMRTVAAWDPRAQVGANSSYRGGLMSNSDVTWTTGSLSGLLTTVGGSGFANWTSVVASGGTNGSTFAQMDFAMIYDAVY